LTIASYVDSSTAGRPLAPRPARQRQAGAATLIGGSIAMKELKNDIARVAESDAKVLISGESGTGKELVAYAIHASSPRAARPFVAVNCAGIPETLLESELFGHVRGSFTGAYRDKAGKIEMADQGTIFLDEVGEMTLRMQGLLLRFLETGEIQKVGADTAARTPNVRVIAATNRQLSQMVAQGQFREDLYYRLKVIELHVPPLRERAGDIDALIDHFLVQFEGRPGCRARRFTPEAQAILRAYEWPGNVRELENVIERLAVTARHELIDVNDLPPEVSARRGWGTHRRERRRTVADDLFDRMTRNGESFWSVVYPLYMQREITRGNVRDVVRKGLEQTRGSYKILTRLYNMEPGDYKRFLNFLRKHSCQVAFKTYR
jgi:transcriptional regulator with PAS, ATPase and Fis domain